MLRSALLVGLLSVTTACARPPLPPPPPPPFLAFPDPTDIPDNSLGDVAIVRARAEAGGVTLTDADLRMNLVLIFATRARAANLPGFNEVWVSYDDARKWINVGSKPPIDRAAYLAMAAPELHRDIRFRQSVFDKQETADAIERIGKTLGPDGLWCIMSFDYDSDYVVLNTLEDADLDKVRRKVPRDLAQYVRVEQGGCPVLVSGIEK